MHTHTRNTQAQGSEATLASLPQIGQELHAGKFAGVTTDKTGVVYALILLSDKPVSRMTFPAACAWAEALGDGATLPNRVESAMLFANLKSEFEEAWHWTSESESGWAWAQSFNGGTQSGSSKGDEFRARAVRRLVLSHSVI